QQAVRRDQRLSPWIGPARPRRTRRPVAPDHPARFHGGEQRSQPPPSQPRGVFPRDTPPQKKPRTPRLVERLTLTAPGEEGLPRGNRGGLPNRPTGDLKRFFFAAVGAGGAPRCGDASARLAPASTARRGPESTDRGPPRVGLGESPPPPLYT